MAHIEPNSTKTKDNMIDFELWKEGQHAGTKFHSTQFSLLRQRQHCHNNHQMQQKNWKGSQSHKGKIEQTITAEDFDHKTGRSRQSHLLGQL